MVLIFTIHQCTWWFQVPKNKAHIQSCRVDSNHVNPVSQTWFMSTSWYQFWARRSQYIHFHYRIICELSLQQCNHSSHGAGCCVYMPMYGGEEIDLKAAIRQLITAGLSLEVQLQSSPADMQTEALETSNACCSGVRILKRQRIFVSCSKSSHSRRFGQMPVNQNTHNSRDSTEKQTTLC